METWDYRNSDHNSDNLFKIFSLVIKYLCWHFVPCRPTKLDLNYFINYEDTPNRTHNVTNDSSKFFWLYEEAFVEISKNIVFLDMWNIHIHNTKSSSEQNAFCFCNSIHQKRVFNNILNIRKNYFKKKKTIIQIQSDELCKQLVTASKCNKPRCLLIDWKLLPLANRVAAK